VTSRYKLPKAGSISTTLRRSPWSPLWLSQEAQKGLLPLLDRVHPLVSALSLEGYGSFHFPWLNGNPYFLKNKKEGNKAACRAGPY
jgi:hypothetical protein